MLHYFNVVPYAQRSLEIQHDRLRKWLARSPDAQAKIGERADELRDFARLLEWVDCVRKYMPTWLHRERKAGFMEGYEQGYANAKDLYEKPDYYELLVENYQLKNPNVDLTMTDDDVADMYAEFPWLQKMENILTRTAA